MSAIQELRGLLKLRALQLLALSVLLILLASVTFRARLAVRDPDIWWHLETGNWILQHHAVPFVGIFSRTAATHPWVAYSWAYEVLMSCAYSWFGLVGFAMFGILLTMAVAFILFWMLHRLSGDFWLAWLLAVIGNLVFLFSLIPRPVFVTMILYIITLTFLLESARTGSMRLLWWLPLVFALWANVHIQFIYGLATVGLFMGINLLQRLASRFGIAPGYLQPPTLPLSGLIGVLVACFAATFVGPYTYHIYPVVIEYAFQAVPFAMIQELQALTFVSFEHFLLLLLTAAAFFAVGWQRKLDLFKLSLLIAATMITFRSARDAWFVAISAVLFLADLRPGQRSLKEASQKQDSQKEDLPRQDSPGEVPRKPVLNLPELAGVAAVLAIGMLLLARDTGFNTRDLDRVISREFPVNAVNFVRRNSFSGPLYNNLDWGGFLIWYLPQYPVAIDGRTNLYGDQMNMLMYKSSGGDESYTSDPYLNEAGLVLLPKKLPLAQLLTIDPRFRLVYRDELAFVFVRN